MNDNTQYWAVKSDGSWRCVLADDVLEDDETLVTEQPPSTEI
ncbi:hypothetical protein [Mangrovibacter sp. MFB070]|nr:hypothetical protein [Mangrovibacter sp. MFB070]